MNNTLQLFWSSGLHIARIFNILHKKNTQLTQLKKNYQKTKLLANFLLSFHCSIPTGQSSLLISISF